MYRDSSFSHNAQRHGQTVSLTDRQTDRQTTLLCQQSFMMSLWTAKM